MIYVQYKISNISSITIYSGLLDIPIYVINYIIYTI